MNNSIDGYGSLKLTNLKARSAEIDDLKTDNITSLKTITAESLTIDATDTRAFVVRKNNVGSDVFTVNTDEGKVNITGDLLVNGNANYYQSDNHLIEDNIPIFAHNNNLDTLYDLGIFFQYGASGSTGYRGFFYDLTDSTWNFANTATEPNNTVGTYNLENFKVSKLFINSDIEMNNTKILNLANPANAGDAVNKLYVDNLIQSTNNQVVLNDADIATLFNSVGSISSTLNNSVLLLDGSKTMTGNLNMGAYGINTIGSLVVNSASAVTSGLSISRFGALGRAQMRFADESNNELWRIALTGAGGEGFNFFTGSDNVFELTRCQTNEDSIITIGKNENSTYSSILRYRNTFFSQGNGNYLFLRGTNEDTGLCYHRSGSSNYELQLLKPNASNVDFTLKRGTSTGDNLLRVDNSGNIQVGLTSSSASTSITFLNSAFNQGSANFIDFASSANPSYSFGLYRSGVSPATYEMTTLKPNSSTTSFTWRIGDNFNGSTQLMSVDNVGFLAVGNQTSNDSIEILLNKNLSGINEGNTCRLVYSNDERDWISCVKKNSSTVRQRIESMPNNSNYSFSWRKGGHGGTEIMKLDHNGNLTISGGLTTGTPSTYPTIFNYGVGASIFSVVAPANVTVSNLRIYFKLLTATQGECEVYIQASTTTADDIWNFTFSPPSGYYYDNGPDFLTLPVFGNFLSLNYAYAYSSTFNLIGISLQFPSNQSNITGSFRFCFNYEPA